MRIVRIKESGACLKGRLPCTPKPGPGEMLEYPENEEEGSDERHAVQSGEDHLDLKRSGLPDEQYRRVV